MNRFDILNSLPMLLIPIAVGVLQIVIINQSDLSGGARDADDYVIKQPKAFVWVGLICTLLFIGFIIAMTIFPNETVTWHVYLVFFFFVMLGAYLSLYCLFYRVSVHENEIQYRRLLKPSRTFTFEEIKRARVKRSGIWEQLTVYFEDGHSLKVDSLCKGYTIFINHVRKYALHSFVDYYRYKN